METLTHIPPFLAPEKEFTEIGAFCVLECFSIAERFANEYEIELEIAFVSMLAGLSHSIGGAVVVESTVGQIPPPFSLLVITPSSDPVWHRAPIRFLSENFGETMEMLARLRVSPPARGEGRDEEVEISPEQERVRERTRAARQLLSSKIAERIAIPSIVPPFPRLPFDDRVLLTTPAVGLKRAMRQLNSDQRIRLEVALCMNRPFPTMSDEPSGAAPNFFWQIPKEDAPTVFQENPWLASVPFLMLESQCNGAVKLATGGISAELHRICQDLFHFRFRAMNSRTTLSMDGRSFRPLQEFLEAAQEWKATGEENISVQPLRVVEQAIKFAQIFAVLQNRREPDPIVDITPGLELAKRLAARHAQNLVKYATPPVARNLPDTSGLSERERATYLRICERPGVSPSDLSRSFNRMRRAERDEILCRLFQRSLVESRDGGLWKSELQVAHTCNVV